MKVMESTKLQAPTSREAPNFNEHGAAEPQLNHAERLECVELAPAVERRGSSKAGASSTHSKRSATTHALKISATCVHVELLPYSGRQEIFGAWCLGFLWCLVLGVWCFLLAGCQSPEPRFDSASASSAAPAAPSRVSLTRQLDPAWL